MIAIAATATLAAFLLFITVLYRKDMVKSTFFPFMLLAVLFYQLGNLIEILSTTIEVANVGLKIRFIGIPFVPTLWYLYVREFCGLKFRKKWTQLCLFVVPVTIAVLAATWESNHLLFSGLFYPEGNPLGNPELVPGPLFPLRLAYQYTVNILGLVTLIWQYRKGTPRFRRQMSLFLFSALIPFFNIVTYTVDISAYNVDVTPYALVVLMTLLAFLMYRFGVINRAGIIKENALDHVHEGVILFDREGVFMDSNRAARSIFPQLQRVPLGTSVSEMAYLPFNATALENDVKTTYEFTRKDEGSIKTFGVSIASIRFRSKPVGFGVILNNISSLKKTMDELEERSIKDPLTKLYNRGYLFTLGEDRVKNAPLNSEPFSVVMFDIDHFKRVNDTYGHLYGDYVLREMSEVCSIGLRQSDILARYGGEEFCLLLSNTPLEGAYSKAESLRAKISSHRFVQEDVQTTVTASFGVAGYDRSLDEDTFHDILKRADTNLYKAKSGGRNRVC